MDAVKGELTAIYNWNENDFSEISWEVLEQMHRVLETATGSHFGVAKKASTYAWAYDVARKRVRKQRETKS